MNDAQILYQDAFIIVLDKPSGLSVHGSARGNGAPTLADWLGRRFPELKEVGEPLVLEDGTEIKRPGITHRLDRDTSGVMVVARTQGAYEDLKRQFGEREVQKVYRAFVYGKITEERGVIDKPIGRSTGGGSERTVKQTRGRLRDARTVFHTRLARAKASYLDVFPKTGRTHQIRVHLASIGHGVVADALYSQNKPPILGFTRLALHALSLSFKHPQNGQARVFEAPLSEEFSAAEEQLRRE